ncbi:hypothetical protein NQ318_010667 [Aromia moschata]|uniref:Cytochrome P450 n=1 Tax=Aromia moschata TaxID=1265417 RepID=A0AAV8XRQ7_9CUCU|nr:hypothetical protein NQ318_010667 [Aromia moschata]
MADIFMATYVILAISAAVCIFILWFYKQAFNYWKKRGLEYLEPTIPFGNAVNLCMKRCTLGEIFAQFYLQLKKKGVKHGGAYLFWKPVYIPIDPNIIKKILISDFDYFPNRGLYINERDDPLSGHLFTMENKEWKIYILKMFKLRVIAREAERFFIVLSKNIMDYRKRKCLKTGDLADTLIQLTNDNDQKKLHHMHKNYTMQPLNCNQVASQMAVFFCGRCQIKLRNEIRETLAKHYNGVTYDSVMEMKYLDWVVDETLRLYPVLPIVPRICEKDYKVPGTEVIIEKGCFVMVTNMGLHRDPEYYPDPDKFDPERFSPENKSSRPNVAYIPFGEGARICVGKRFGLLATKLGVIAMILNFEVTLNEKTTKQIKFETNELIFTKNK